MALSKSWRNPGKYLGEGEKDSAAAAEGGGGGRRRGGGGFMRSRGSLMGESEGGGGGGADRANTPGVERDTGVCGSLGCVSEEGAAQEGR